MDWLTIENSYFWITYKRGSRDLTVRFLNPFKTRVMVFRFSFSREIINLVSEDTIVERIDLAKKLVRSYNNELTAAIAKQKNEEINKLQLQIKDLKLRIKSLEQQHKQE